MESTSSLQEMMRYWPLIVGGIVALVVASGALMYALNRPGHRPWIDVRITEVRGEVEFEFFLKKRVLWWQREVPVGIFSLAVHKPGEEPDIWRVVDLSGQAHPMRIKYGVLPQGFVQEEPRHGSAPRLSSHERYAESVRGSGGLGAKAFVYTGRKLHQSLGPQYPTTAVRRSP